MRRRRSGEVGVDDDDDDSTTAKANDNDADDDDDLFGTATSKEKTQESSSNLSAQLYSILRRRNKAGQCALDLAIDFTPEPGGSKTKIIAWLVDNQVSHKTNPLLTARMFCCLDVLPRMFGHFVCFGKRRN